MTPSYCPQVLLDAHSLQGYAAASLLLLSLLRSVGVKPDVLLLLFSQTVEPLMRIHDIMFQAASGHSYLAASSICFNDIALHVFVQCASDNWTQN